MPLGGSTDEPFDSGGATGSPDAEEAADAAAAEDTAEFGDEFGDDDGGGGTGGTGDPTIIPPTPMERSDPAPASAPGGTEPTAPAGDTTTGTAGGTTGTTTRPDPTAESSPGGVAVTGTEARRALASGTIDDLDERQALAAQVENITGFDARRAAARRGGGDVVDVALRGRQFETTVDMARSRARRQARRRRRTRVPAGLEDDPLGPEAAQDAAAAGAITPVAPGVRDARLSPERAQDLAASGAILPPATTGGDAAEAGADLVASGLERGRRSPEQVRRDLRARVRRQLEERGRDPDQFDVDIQATDDGFTATTEFDPTGETALDERIEQLEAETGLDVIPGEGDVVQQTQRELGDLAGRIRAGETPLPTVQEARRFGARGAELTVTPSDTPVRVGDATLTRTEAARQFGGDPFGIAASTANVPASVLQAGRTVEGTGEFVRNRALAGADPPEDVRLAGVEAETVAEIEAVSQAAETRAAEQEAETQARVEQAVESVRERPAGTLGAAGFTAGTAVVGTLGTRLLTRVPDAGRAARLRATTSDRIDFSDVTTEEAAATGELPEFDTPRSAPTAEAVAEVRRRAAENPEQVTTAVGEERTLFHSTQADLGSEVEVARGGSELPGLFTAPDASPLRLDAPSGTSLFSTNIRLPRPRDFTPSRDRLAAFPGDRIEGAPRRAAGSGRRFNPATGEFEPDPETPGAQFLEGEAEGGTAFVRPTGGRTRELEAIFPPESEFAQTGRVAVELPSGRTVPLDVFRRAEDVPDAADSTALQRFLADERARITVGDDADLTPRRTVDAGDLAREFRRRDRAPDGEPAVPSPPTPDAGDTTMAGAARPSAPRVGDRTGVTARGVTTPADPSADIGSGPSAAGPSEMGPASTPPGTTPPGASRPPGASGPSVGGPSAGPPSGRSPSGPPSSPQSVVAPPSGPPTPPGELEFTPTDPRRFDFRTRRDFEKRFRQGVAAPDVVTSGDLSDLGDVGDPAAVEAIDTDLDPVVTETRGDPAAATEVQAETLSDLGVDVDAL